VLIATHDLALIERIGARVLRLEGGQLVAGGDAA
jgi:ABC-type ATPase involved in cell division